MVKKNESGPNEDLKSDNSVSTVDKVVAGVLTGVTAFAIATSATAQEGDGYHRIDVDGPPGPAVVNHAPSCELPPEVVLDEGFAVIDTNAYCSDQDGDSLDIAVSSPTLSTDQLINNDGVIAITAPGTVHVEVSDGTATRGYDVAVSGTAGASLGAAVAAEPTPEPVDEPVVPTPIADLQVEEPAAPTDLETTVEEEADATVPAASSGITWGLYSILGFNADGANNATFYPEILGGNLTLPNGFQLRLAGLGGYLSGTTPEPGYDHEGGAGGVHLGFTIPMSQAGTLFLDGIYVGSNISATPHIVYNEENGALIPDLETSAHGGGASLVWLLGENGWLGSLSAEVGVSTTTTSADQRIETTDTVVNDPEPEVTHDSEAGLTFTHEHYSEETITHVSDFDGQDEQTSVGWVLHYLSPSLGNTGLQIGVGGGTTHDSVDTHSEDTFTDSVVITGHDTMTIEDAFGNEVVDENPIDVNESDSTTVPNEDLHLSNQYSFLDILGAWNLEIPQFAVHAGGLLRVFTDEELPDDHARLEGSLYAILRASPDGAPGIFSDIQLGSNLLSIDRGYQGSLMLLLGEDDSSDLENYYQTVATNTFGFQPEEMQHLRLELATAQFMNGLDGLLIGWGMNNGEQDDQRFSLGYGFAPVAAVIEYVYGDDYGLTTHDMSLGVTIKDDVLQIGSLGIRGGFTLSDPVEGDGLQLSDYRGMLVFTANFGGEGEE